MLKNSHWEHTAVITWNRKLVFQLLKCGTSASSGMCCRFAFSPSLWAALALCCETPREHNSVTPEGDVCWQELRQLLDLFSFSHLGK